MHPMSQKNILHNPQANLITNKTPESWYQVNAASQPTDPVVIYLYDMIGHWGISAQAFLQDCRKAGLFDASSIEVHIHSPGGDVMDGFAIFNSFSRLTAKVDIYIDGLAASMASVLICLPNATVHIPENAWVMVHKPWGGVMGDSDEIREYAEWLDRNESLLLSAYANKTGLSREEIAAMLKEETWLEGAMAIEKGFADVLEAPLSAAALINSNKMKEFHNMPKQVKALITPHAAIKEPTTLPNSEVKVMETPNAAMVDLEQLAQSISQQLLAANTERVTAIKSVFDAFPAFSALQTECISDQTCTVDSARNKLLSALASGVTPSTTYAVQLHAGNGNLVGDSVRASLLARAGYDEVYKDNIYNGLTLRELARASLADRGIGLSGLSPMAMVGMAFTHTQSDFGNILMDVAHKAVLLGWNEAEETFDRWTRKGTLTDFKVSHRVGLNSLAALRKVRDGAEYKYITVGDKAEPIALATYGELFSLTRQTIINDDLDILTRIPAAMGGAARATIGDLVYAILTANGKLSDGHALFSAEHNNVIKAAMDIEGLDAARNMMRLQKSGSRTLNIRPAYVLTPVVLESRANQLIKSTSVPGAETNSGINNPIQNFAEVIGEPRLDIDNPKAFYLTAAQGRDTIEVAYLDGIETPYVEQQTGFTIDGAAFKVRIDAGVAALDHRGLVKSTGSN